MSSVAIKNRAVTVMDFSRVTKNNNLSFETCAFLGWGVGGVRSDVSSFKFFDGETFDIETNVVSWDSLFELSVMHFNGLNFSRFFRRSESNHHTWFEDTSFDSTDWDSTDSTDFVDILEWKSEWFVDWSLWRFKFIEGLVESFTFVPFHIVRFIDHIITVPS